MLLHPETKHNEGQFCIMLLFVAGCFFCPSEEKGSFVGRLQPKASEFTFQDICCFRTPVLVKDTAAEHKSIQYVAEGVSFPFCVVV